MEEEEEVKETPQKTVKPEKQKSKRKAFAWDSGTDDDEEVEEAPVVQPKKVQKVKPQSLQEQEALALQILQNRKY